MDQKTRIKKDIIMFEENLEKNQKNNLTKKQKKIIELATQYYNDAKYYFERKDFFTSFGCVNYAHGLLDAVIKF